MNRNDLKAIIEALIFASDIPLSIDKIKRVLENVSRKDIQNCINQLYIDYQKENRGFFLREVAGGFQLITNPSYASWIKKLIKVKPVRFTQPTLETLVIIAYKQPVTKAEVEKIRGVESGGIIKSLLEKNLITIVGKKNIPGRPFLFTTTKKFLEVFGLDSLSSLPPLKDIEDIDGSNLPELLRERASKVNKEKASDEFLDDADSPGQEGEGVPEIA